MDIGLLMYPTGKFIDVAPVAELAEELGFESLWVPEHAVIPVATVRNGPAPRAFAYMADPFVALGRASSVTGTLKLGTAVCLVPEHNPLLLAKEVATLDLYSGGRFLFGIGAGWLQGESEVMGVDFEHRWTQTRESVLAMKELWTRDESEYHGAYYDFPAVYSFPKPVQRPHPPVLLGSAAPNVFAWWPGPTAGCPSESARRECVKDGIPLRRWRRRPGETPNRSTSPRMRCPPTGT